MNKLPITHLGLTLYIPIDIENNTLCAQNIILVSKNNIKMSRHQLKKNKVKHQLS
jgi:hypothetical protein